MSYSNYCALIEEFSKVANLATGDEPHAPMNLTVDGVDFVLAHGGENHSHAVALFCNFGAVPEEWPSHMILKRLLEANLALFAPGGMRFGINPMMNEVMLSGAVPMRGLTASALLTMLQGCAGHAKDWREHFFLRPPATGSAR